MIDRQMLDQFDKENAAIDFFLAQQRAAREQQEREREREQEVIRKMMVGTETRQADPAPDVSDQLDEQLGELLDIIGEEVGKQVNELQQKIDALDARINKLETDAAVARGVVSAEATPLTPKGKASHAA
jgi:archaellum component FlaC